MKVTSTPNQPHIQCFPPWVFTSSTHPWFHVNDISQMCKCVCYTHRYVCIHQHAYVLHAKICYCWLLHWYWLWLWCYWKHEVKLHVVYYIPSIMCMACDLLHLLWFRKDQFYLYLSYDCPTYCRYLQNMDDIYPLHWLYQNNTKQNKTIWAPSQYKRLSFQVWGFPC